MTLIETLSTQANIIRNKPEFYHINEDKIEIKYLTVGQLISISPFISQIQLEGEIKSPEDFHEKAITQIDKYMEPIRAVFNELIDYDFDKLLPVDIVNILLMILHQIDTKSYNNAFFLLERISRNNRESLLSVEKIFSTL